MFLTSECNGVRVIKFNRPEKKNSFPPGAYQELADILNEDAKNDTIIVTILTGVGEYYSSGTELKVTEPLSPNRSPFEPFRNLVLALLNYPKIIIAVVNGPAIGVAATTLALCDVVYASDRATFQTPFLSLGLCPEACSSYLFPFILGRSKANEMLLLGHIMDAEEACKFGLVSRVIPHNNLNDFIESLNKYGSISVGSLKRSKRLMRGMLIKELNQANSEEVLALGECFHSEEFFEKMIQFMNRKQTKSKL